MPDDRSDPEQRRLPVRAFINYASDDRALAEWLYRRLWNEGAVAVWWDRKEIEGGDRWKNEIDEGLWKSQLAIAILTRTSADESRTWVVYEQERARSLLKTIIPCLFEDEMEFLKHNLLPDRLKPVDFINFTDREEGFRDLANAISKRLPRYGNMFQNQAEAITHSFVGRDHDLRALKSHIDDESGAVMAGRRTIAIQGMGGLGKTMLANELARRLAFHYPGGILIEERAGQKAPAQLVMERWVEWALQEPPKREYEANEVRHLLGRPNYGELMLLLDDISEEDIRAAQQLLECMPPDAVRLITTRSEEVCRQIGAITYRLEPLLETDALELIRVRLKEHFASNLGDSAEEVDAAIEQHANALSTLIERVDRHPLALHLGIGTCDSLADIPDAVQALTTSLDEGVGRFARGRSALDAAMEATDKNASLAHSLAVSLAELQKIDDATRPRGWRAVLDRLAAHGRNTPVGTNWVSRFRALGIFPDGCKMSAGMIQAVWGDDASTTEVAEDALSGLTRRAMLMVDRKTGYYSNHPVVRAYATELILVEKRQYESVRQRYVRYVTERATDEFAKPQEEWSVVWLLLPHMQKVADILRSSLGPDDTTLYQLSQPELSRRSGLRLLKQTDSDDLASGIKFTHAVAEYVVRRPEWGEVGRKCLRLGLACARAAGSIPNQTEFLKRLGGSHSQGDPELASRYFSAALSLARETGDKVQEGAVLSFYGELERTRGRGDHALELLTAALGIHRQRRDAVMEATTLKYLGELYWRMSRLDDAFDQYHSALLLFMEEDYVSGQADILNKMGSVEFNRGEHRKAIALFDQALELHREIGNRSMEAEDLNDMGAANRYLGELELAYKFFNDALKIHLRLGNRRLESITRANIAGTLWAQGVFERSHREAEHALRIAEEVGDPIPAIWALNWDGLSYRSVGEIDTAEQRLRDAVSRARDANNPRGLAGVLGSLAVLLLDDRKQPVEATKFLQEALAAMEEHGLDQAFGERRFEEFKELLGRAEQATD